MDNGYLLIMPILWLLFDKRNGLTVINKLVLGMQVVAL